MKMATPQTLIAFTYGELAVSVAMTTHLSPDMVDSILIKTKREFVTAARQLGVVIHPEDETAATEAD